VRSNSLLESSLNVKIHRLRVLKNKVKFALLANIYYNQGILTKELVMENLRFADTRGSSFFGEFLYGQVVTQGHFLRQLNQLMDLERFTRRLLKLYKGGGLVGPPTPIALRDDLLRLYPVVKLNLLKSSGHTSGTLKADDYIRLIDEFFQAELEQLNNSFQLSADKKKGCPDYRQPEVDVGSVRYFLLITGR
jgi:hypothetical protein